jgi:hypothetical protein
MNSRHLAVLATLLIAVGLVLGNARSAIAMHGTISGTVTDATTSIPLENVCITLGPPIRCWTSTNSLGQYLVDLTGLGPDGQMWDLYFLRTGFIQQKQTVTVNGPTTLDVAMARTNPNEPVPSATPVPGTVQPSPPPVPKQTPCPEPRTGDPTNTVYLPNVTKTLGGANGFQTPFIVQNTGAAATDLEVTFYRFTDGSCVARLTRTGLLAGTSQAYSPNALPQLPHDTQFAVVVRSFGTAVVAVVNEHAGTGDRAEALSYNGISAGSMSVSLPNITRRFFGYVTPFIIQNLSATTTTATARFVSFDGSAPSFTISRTIEPGRSKSVDPNSDDATLGAPGAMDGKQYAVTVTASAPLGVVVNTHNDAPTVSAPVAYATDGLTGGSATLYGAYAAKNAQGVGRLTTIVVQNTGSTSVTPGLTFTPLGGGASQTFTSPSSIAAGGSWAFDPRFTLGTTTPCSGASATCLGDGEYTFVASAQSAPIAAVVNVISPTTAMGYATTGTPAAKYFLPNVTKTLGGSTGWTTPILVQSATATGATLKWYRFSDGSLVHTQSIATTAGTGLRVDPRDIAALPHDTQFAVVVEGPAGTVNAIVTEFASGGDNAMTYEGFGAP